jgi:uncharacterized glyoxalase superfamily protein PhnB
VTPSGRSVSTWTSWTSTAAGKPDGARNEWIQLQPEDGGATITLTTWFDYLKPGGQQGLMLHVADVDAERDRLIGKGLDVAPIEEQTWGRYTTIKDPDGNGWVVTTQIEPD